MKVSLLMQRKSQNGPSSRSFGLGPHGLDLPTERVRKDAILHAAHQLVGLLSQTEGQNLIKTLD